MCVHMCMNMHVCVHSCVGALGYVFLNQCTPLIFFFSQSLSLNLELAASVDLTSQQTPVNPSISALPSSLQCQAYRQALPHMTVGAEDPNSSAHACRTSPSPTQTAPPSQLAYI